MHAVRSIIAEYVNLESPDWERIEAGLVRRNLVKGEVLLEQGEVCRTLWFLEAGLLRYYTNGADGVERTKFFTLAPYCFTSQVSFSKNLPAQEAIQALEPSMVWEMPADTAYALLVLPVWAEFIRKLVLEVQAYTEELLVGAISVTPVERYAQLLQSQQALVARVPIKYLASYLGIAPQSLSRIRRRATMSAKSNLG
jgi:CRP/FNR family transcriptional regulator, anaerobic regulatory protein